MATRSSKPKKHDFVTAARRTVEHFIGEKLTGEPLEDPNAGKNPAAAERGKLGAKGGKARAKAPVPTLERPRFRC